MDLDPTSKPVSSCMIFYYLTNYFSYTAETHLFAEPGIYMSMLNGVALQGFKASTFTREMIKG